MLKLFPIIAWALLLAFLSDKRSRYVLDRAERKQYTRKDLAIYLVMALVVPVKPDGWNDVIDVDSEVREPREKKEKYKGPEID